MTDMRLQGVTDGPLMARKPDGAAAAQAEAHRIARERWLRSWRTGRGAIGARIAGAFLHCYGGEARTMAHAAWMAGVLPAADAKRVDDALEACGLPVFDALAGIEAARRRAEMGRRL